MSHLRKQLQKARRKYEAARYPGDLAADVLRPARHLARWAGLAASLAAAAAVALAIILHRGDRPIDNELARSEVILPAVDAIEIAPSLSLSEMGSDEALTLPVSDFSFSMPTITFTEDESPENTSTTQET
jgi:hypothetical protein